MNYQQYRQYRERRRQREGYRLRYSFEQAMGGCIGEILMVLLVFVLPMLICNWPW